MKAPRAVRTLRAADRDIELTVQLLAAQSEDAAKAFVLDLRRTVALLASAPMVGRALAPSASRVGAAAGIRVLPMRVFRRHVVFYRVTSRRLTIVRVIHGSRDLHRLALEG